ncbi:hypothetical protein X777_09290 [Ooceraea biroi]|uniref:Uncharacterized protein n=1 Tax=Ooceraea biroi TaxID=2015173 RepID=A0A026W7E1_OOCBI|nr:hypothetical protein X777_09290 [Ooceraea biroi]
MVHPCANRLRLSHHIIDPLLDRSKFMRQFLSKSNNVNNGRYLFEIHRSINAKDRSKDRSAVGRK